MEQTAGEVLINENLVNHIDLKVYNDNYKDQQELTALHYNGNEIYSSITSDHTSASKEFPMNIFIDEENSLLQIKYGLQACKSIDANTRFTCDKEELNQNSLEYINCSQKFDEQISLNNEENTKFTCSFCNSSFCSEDLLNDHMKLNCNGQKIIGNSFTKCQKCGVVLNPISEYHTCVNPKTFKCEKCNRIFNEENELNTHVLENQCRNLNGFTCDTCKRLFTDFNELKRHIAAHLENSLQCVSCNECFNSDTSLANHVCNKKAEENIQCFKCRKLFLTQDMLQEHAVYCSDGVQVCDFCKKDFRDSVEYKNHLSLHIKVCINCNENFCDENKYKEHVRKCKSLHKYECDICSKTFSKLSKLKTHILNIHQLSSECSKCNMKFSSQEELDRHTAGECKTEVCSCKTCGKMFTKKDYLKKHEYIHSNAFFRCKYCHCAFIKEKSYNRHMEKMNCSKSARKIRLNEYNYSKCRICDVDFKEEELLMQHFGIEHPKENPHQCFCCSACLPTFKELEDHINLHNTRKFTCSICSKAYMSQEGFRKHRLKHKGAEFKCQFCKSEFLNERRFKFHVKTCKKNPENACHETEDDTKTNKDERPKLSRQLHWESRIIMKRLRGDPSSVNGSFDQNQDQVKPISIFDEPDGDTNDSNVRGWFDDYYKTEEDDYAFGLKDRTNDANSELKNGSSTNKENCDNGVLLGNDIESSSESSVRESSDSSSEEEEDFIENTELPFNYNPKKCRICLISFSHEYELLHHFIKFHPEKKAHKCPYCEVESPLFAQLKEHMKVHGIGIGIYNCDNCSKRYKSEKKMKSHNIRCKGVYANISDNAKTFQEGEDSCKWCGKKFQTKCGYRRHKLACKEKKKNSKESKKIGSSALNETKELETEPSDTGLTSVDNTDVPNEINAQPAETDTEKSKVPLVVEPPMDSFPCRLCDKKFQYERGIVMHFKAEHPGNKPLICHICNMHLADKLKEHLKTHGIGEEFVCELCGKRFNQKFVSKIHEMWHQGIEYKCSNCKQKFLNKEKMLKHVSENRCSNRQSLMRLPCDICGKSYRSKFGLGKHYITHTPKELRPVKNRMNCEFCGKWFDTNNGLQRHRRIHTGEKPFCCRFCSKSFVQEGNCKSHEKIHTGEPRLRKRKSVPSEPVSYPVDLNLCTFNNINRNTCEREGTQ